MGRASRSRIEKLQAGDSVGAFIAANGRPHTYVAGQPLFYEGDRSLSVYACVSGRIKLFVTVPSGRELLLGLKLPGQEFGELSAIDERPRSASARAFEPSVVARMSGEDFLEGLHDHPQLAILVLRNLALQLRSANARLSARNSERAKARVGQRLLELAALLIRHGGQLDRIELTITQTDLADWVGTTRESTARALADFRRNGIVGTGRGHIVVHDIQALEEAVRAC